jgi:hypothetical protein
MSMLLLDVFVPDGTCKPGLASYHIVTTFKAKESRAPSVLAQSLGRLE